MKSSVHYWLYEMKCIPTDQKYIGRSKRGNPCLRWSEHLIELFNNKSQCPLLQEAWNKHPKVTDWQFRALDEAWGRVNANHREAELILEVPEEKRLNTKKTSTVTCERRKRVLEMLAEGKKYIEIKAEVGLSLGMISKIKNGKHLRHRSRIY